MCTLRSLGSLFCYVIKDKQLQKSLNLSARGIASPPWGQKLHERKSRNCHDDECNCLCQPTMVMAGLILLIVCVCQ